MEVSGDVGMLADENAQRLVSIFQEGATLFLVDVKEAVLAANPVKQQQVAFVRFLATARGWTQDVTQPVVAKLEATYPETSVLHRYVVISVLSEAAYAQGITVLNVPPVAEAFNVFLQRVTSSSDVQDVPHFLAAPLAHRRVVFLEAFRNAYHDVARRHLVSQNGAVVLPLLRASRPQSTQPDDRSSVAESVAPGRSRLREAMYVTSAQVSPPADELLGPCKKAQLPAPSIARTDANPADEPDVKAVMLVDSPTAFFDA